MISFLPDFLIRFTIRELLRRKLADENKGSDEEHEKRTLKFVEELKASPIAIATDEANQQHYELPPEFFEWILGQHLKYSCGLWQDSCKDLDQSEREMLELTCERSQIRDGMKVLELGCGWGSLCLYLAKKFPCCEILAVSNSKPQKKFIEAKAAAQGVRNLAVLTADMNLFKTARTFDRVVSIEMFEHMRNYERLLQKISGFLKPNGKLFVHIFSHKAFAYPYNEKNKNDWIAHYFFTGGIMPSDDLFTYFQDRLLIEKHWPVNGGHYAKTCRAWLGRMDQNKKKIFPILSHTYGAKDAQQWWARWRVFFMACEELFAYRNGEEWHVSHYLWKKK